MSEDKVVSFIDFKIAKPVIRSLNEMNITHPTPIQCKAVPTIVAGSDLCATAITGSGKSIAFLIPIIHKLIPYRGLPGPKCIILSPTRELSTQLNEVFKKLSSHCHVTSALVIGGVSDEEQRKLLTPPADVIIGTPGRLIDAICNAKCLSTDHVQFFVLDEADRLLGKGFENQIQTIHEKIPQKHQTLLFTATLSDQVSKLVHKVLREGYEKIAIDPFMEINPNLTQRFIKVKSEEKRLPVLLALCKNLCKEKTIVFFPTKHLAHQTCLLFNHIGIKSAELHADLGMTMRNESIEEFRSSKVKVLLASDLAARGLDIPDIQFVVNYTIPNEIERYIHRVGRTARAGKSGVSISLYHNPEEKHIMKKVTKNTKGIIEKMTIPSNLMEKASEQISQYIGTIVEEMKREEEERIKRAEENAERRMKMLLDVEEEVLAKPSDDEKPKKKKSKQ